MDEVGYFAFGGSTIVVLTKPKLLKLDADLVANSEKRVRCWAPPAYRFAECHAHSTVWLSPIGHSWRRSSVSATRSDACSRTP